MMTGVAMLVLPILLASQLVSGSPSNPSLRELRDLTNLLNIGGISETEQGDFIKVCSQEPMELGLVIDASSSIPARDFVKGQQFLSDFLNDFDIGPGRKQVRVSAIKFGRGVYKDDSFNLNTYKTKAEVMEHLSNMKHEYGLYTSTGPGIDYMRTEQMSNTRSWAPKIAIVMTDGNSQETQNTKNAAAAARAENITMFAVGVGRSVSNNELLNIAGDQSRVIQVNSYDDLAKIKELLAYKTCVLKPKPTTTPPPTTTPIPTTPMREQECYEKYPSDINFVFSPASLGVDATSWVTQFISHTITNQELEQRFQYGVVTGDCPDDEGFALNAYRTVDAMRSRLDRYDRNNLPTLVTKTATTAFTDARGGRSEARKVTVIFVGKGKVDSSALNRAIQELLDQGSQVFVSAAEGGQKPSGLPSGVTVLTAYDSSNQQAQELVTLICHPASEAEELL